MGTPAYDLDDFIWYCRDKPKTIAIFYDAQLNARQQFGLNTSEELLAFIGNDGLQDLTYWNTEPWRLNPKKDKEILVDTYKFHSNQKFGYIAFMKGGKGNYVVKSFHLDNVKLTVKNIGSNSEKLLEQENE